MIYVLPTSEETQVIERITPRGGGNRRALTVMVMAGLALGAGAGTAALARASAAGQRAATVDVPRMLGARIASVKRHDGGIAVLLPSSLALLDPRFAAGAAARNDYRLELDYAEPCDGANVCVSVLFAAQRGGSLHGRPEALADHLRGAFSDIQCGAACSPAQIQWREHRVLYTIAGTLAIEVRAGASRRQVRAQFVAAANQAIKAGPR